MSISLSKIRGFIAIAEHGTFRKASDEIGLSQPALSAQIADLEDHLGLRLLHRTTRQVRVTPEGERFLVRVKRILSELDAVVSELRDEANLQRGNVVVGVVPTIAAHVFPRILAAYSERLPGIDVRLIDEVAGSLEERVTRSEVDFAICPAPIKRHALDFTPIVTDPFVVVFPQFHKFVRRSRVRLKEVVKFPLITLVQGTNVRTILDNAFAKENIPFIPKYEVFHHYTMGGMIEAGLGITLLPSQAVSMMSSPLLRWANLIDPGIARTVGIIRRKGETLSPAAMEFLQTLEPMLSGKGATDSWQ